MITAAELYKISLKAREAKQKEDYEEAHKIIEEILSPRLRSVAESGDLEYTCGWPGWSDYMWLVIKNNLESRECGYIVNRHREAGDTILYISWAHANKRKNS